MDELPESTLQMSCPTLNKKTMLSHKTGVTALTNQSITQLIQTSTIKNHQNPDYIIILSLSEISIHTKTKL